MPQEGSSPVCIAGMHRSGTSTVAQLLYRSGLHLGDEDELMAGNRANADGYWENLHFVKVNDDILKAYGGGWDMPPPFPPGWERAEKIRPLRERAQGLVDRLERGAGRGEVFGWKDPRNSITLPFWLSLTPEMRVVVCLRNPLETARSIGRRGPTSLALCLSLWKAYNLSIREALNSDRYIVTHYDSYFSRPRTELRRVLRFAGIPASDQLVSLVRSRVIQGNLRNQAATTQELRGHDPSGEIGALYADLCERAGWDPDRGAPRRVTGTAPRG